MMYETSLNAYVQVFIKKGESLASCKLHVAFWKNSLNYDTTNSLHMNFYLLFV